MDPRKAKLLKHVDFRKSSGLEIGPLNRPIVTKDQGAIFYIDYTTLEELKRIHKVDPNIPQDGICGPDFIWGEKTLAEAVGEKDDFEYLLASHVIEHVPNLVGWFREISEVLKVGGTVSLAIPDKRFTFDYFRPLTSLGDILEAHWRGARRPSLRHVWDAISMTVKVDVERAWEGPIKEGELENYNSLESTLGAIEQCRSNPEHYHDCHCWVFTPNHLLKLFEGLATLGLLDFYVYDLVDTAAGDEEFFVSLKKLDPDLPLSEKLKVQLPSFSRWHVSDDVDYRERPKAMSEQAKAGTLRQVLRKIRHLGH